MLRAYLLTLIGNIPALASVEYCERAEGDTPRIKVSGLVVLEKIGGVLLDCRGDDDFVLVCVHSSGVFGCLFNATRMSASIHLGVVGVLLLAHCGDYGSHFVRVLSSDVAGDLPTQGACQHLCS